MPKSHITQMQVEPIGTNCYIVANDDTHEAFIVDPGGSAPGIIKQIEKEELKPVAILLTHAHYDHIGGVDELVQKFGITVIACDEEKATFENPRSTLAAMFGDTVKCDVDRYVHDGDSFSVAGFDIKVFHTPGHTPGSCCFYLESEGVVFSGDTLFCNSVGRTDFPGGSMSAIVNSIKEKLFALPDDVQVLPGHDARTTIGFERKYNPFV